MEGKLAAQPPTKIEDPLARSLQPEANVPLLILEATRAAAENALIVPAGARNLVLWLEVESSTRFSSFRMQIYASDNRLVQTVGGLKRNPQGALAVSLPAEALPAGKYVVKVYGAAQAQTELIGEYRLQVKRQ